VIEFGGEFGELLGEMGYRYFETKVSLVLGKSVQIVRLAKRGCGEGGE
jgi:hypothetical protein